MSNPTPFLLSGLLLLSSACAASQTATSCPELESPSEASFPDGETQIAVPADEIAWGPCPPGLPSSCKMAVLEGDPKRAMLFTVRVLTRGQFEMRPHWHPGNERVTILEGKIGVGFGDTIERDQATWFGPGDYYVNARGAHHFVLADGPAVLQITGIGPWEVHYLDAEQTKSAGD